ncbi:MAG: EAL domain-containing protein [Rhodocyclaceae bacterium]|nr:EAL domain-containing protein [Rhodocyclaceae bacterium]
MKRKSVALRLAMLLVPTALAIGLALTGVYLTELKSLDESTAAHGRNAVEIAAAHLGRDIDRATREVIYLANSRGLKAALDAAVGSPGQAQAIAQLASDWQSLSRAKQIYDQIRWLDESGRERVRIDHVSGSPHIAPAGALQDKSRRYYFSDAFKLNRGEIFISPLDLNVEHGQIEKPYRPMIRIGTPVFDEAGRKRGIVLVNNLATDLIDRVRISSGPDVWLLNSEGYWLAGPSPEVEWGFMLGDRSRRMGVRHPEAWARISNAEQGNFETAEGLWSFLTVKPLSLGQATSTGSGEPYQPSRTLMESDAYQWKVVHHLSSASHFRSIGAIRQRVAWIGVAALALLALGAWRLGRSMRAEQAAAKAIAELNVELEDKVADRTSELAEENVRRRRVEEEATALATRYHSVLEASADGFWLVDQDGVIMDTNAAYCNMVCRPREAVIGRSIPDFDSCVPPASVPARIAEITALGSDRFESAHRSADGVDIPVEVSVAAIPGTTRQCAFIRDIRTRVAAEEKLRLAAQVFEQAREGIMITDTEGTIIEANDSFTRITGYAADEAIGKNPRILRSGRQGPQFYGEMWHELKKKGHWYGELWNRRKSGGEYLQSLAVTAIRDKAGRATNYVALFTDITLQREHERQLDHAAHYDSLTSLPNRLLLSDRLHQSMMLAQRHGQRLAIAYVDLDGFREINERLGREAGDLLLAEAAVRIRSCLREGDTIARVGGDEFALVIGDFTSDETCALLLARVLKVVAEPFTIEGAPVSITASMGVSTYPQEDDVDADQLFRQADQAMYQAKLSGRSHCHFFDTAKDRSERGTHESIEAVRVGLEQGQFQLHYQPKVHMRSGEVIGAEALLRWNHPERGVLSPAGFLPVTENHPISEDIGEWVIDAALGQIGRWRAEGSDIAVSVNISARHLQRPDFFDRLENLLAGHPDVPPRLLELEVLETSALEDMARISKLIASCSRLGIRFSLDDFGTGYSSLSYLKRLPVATVKIDQSFVRDMLRDPDDLAILEGVIALASAFKREVVAEGVETVEHGTMLLRLGCEYGQGYGIARPMPARQLSAWIKAWQPHEGWRDKRRLGRANVALIAAQIELRTWVERMVGRLSRREPPGEEISPYCCRLGRWLATEGEANYGSKATFADVATQHHELHRLVRTSFEWDAEDAGPDRTHEDIEACRDRLLDRIERLIDDCERLPAPVA